MKRIQSTLLAMLILLLLGGCGSGSEAAETGSALRDSEVIATPTIAASAAEELPDDMPEEEPEPLVVAEGYDVLGGMWKISSVYANARFVDISTNTALADLYDSQYLFFNPDGSFSFWSIFVHSGVYSKYETSSEQECYFLKTERVFRPAYEDGEVVEKESTSDTMGSYLVTYYPEDKTIMLEDFDPLTGMGKPDGNTYILTKETEEPETDKFPGEIAEPEASGNVDVEQEIIGTWESTNEEFAGQKLVFASGGSYTSISLINGRENQRHGTYRILSGVIETTVENSNGSVVVSDGLTYRTDGGVFRLYDVSGSEMRKTDGSTASSNSGTSVPSGSTFNPSGSSSASGATMGEKNALAKAKDYLDFMAFSYSGLIEQLEFEGFTHSEAVYGADNCGADWYEQAVQKAADYLDFMAFSKTGLIEQLEFEGFTHEQAVYGAEQNGY